MNGAAGLHEHVDFIQHAGFLLLVNAAMTSICLAVSSLMRTAEQASLLSIYLVGFQLPLSGAVLALLCYGPFHIHPDRRKQTTCEPATGSMERDLLGQPRL